MVNISPGKTNEGVKVVDTLIIVVDNLIKPRNTMNSNKPFSIR
jgi:hypothetical protein